MHEINNNKSNIFALLTVLLWSTVASAFKIGLKYTEPPVLLLISSITSLVFFAIIVNVKYRKSINYNIESLAKSSLSGFLNPFLYYLILFEAYSLLPAQIAQPLNYTWIIVVALLMSIFAGHKLHIAKFLGLIISFAGVIVLSTQGSLTGIGDISITGIVLALSSSMFWGFYWILNIRDKRNDIEKLYLNFIFGTIFILIYVIIEGKFIIGKESILSGIYIGMFEMGLTFYTWMKALQYSNDAGKTGNIIYLTPFISLIFIYTILGEPISIQSFFGLILIIAGIFFTTFFRKIKF